MSIEQEVQNDLSAFDIAFDASVSGSETPPAETPPAETPPAEPTPAEPPPAEPPPTAYQFTTDEQAVLDAAFELYPELPQVVALIEKRITETQNAVRAFELQRVSAELAQRFAPALSEAQMSAQQRWLAQVQAQHPDILTIRDSIISWVETQPAILRQAYNRVLDGGTVQETVELADIYKKSIAPPAKPTPTVVPPKVDPKVEAQLDEQEAIKSRATAKVGEYVDANDFDSAFKLAAG